MGALLFVFIMILTLTSPAGLSAEQRSLKGQVLHGKNPVMGAMVSIVDVGNPYTTLHDGGYRVLVPDDIVFGQTIRLHVRKSGWGIDKPEGGKFELPKELAKDIFLLPEASSEFVSIPHIDEFLESLPEKAKTQVKLEGKREEIDPTQAVKDYALEHEISYREVLASVEKRVKFYEQEGDSRQQCLAAVYRKDLEKINKLCKAKAKGKIEQLERKRQEIEKLSKGGLRSKLSDERFSKTLVLDRTFVSYGKLVIDSPQPKSKQSKLDEAKRELVKLIEEVVSDFRLAGDAYYANYEFDKALGAYQEGLGYVAKRDIPTLWAAVLRDIGNANQEIGIRREGEALHGHLTAAVTAYRQALTVYTREQFLEAWAGIQNNLANTLSQQGIRTGGEEGRQLLAQAVAVYRDALRVRTKAHLPEGWAQTHNNLAKASLYLEDWPQAAESYRNVLFLYPDYAEAYLAANGIYQEKLFAYAEAFEVTKLWLERHPDDLAAQMNFAEAHFTTGRFSKAETRLQALLTKPLDATVAIPLQALHIATLTVLNKREAIPDKLNALYDAISKQPEKFKLEWSFAGSKHFITQDERLASYRIWLLQLLSALEEKDRDSILTALQIARENFRAL